MSTKAIKSLPLCAGLQIARNSATHGTVVVMCYGLAIYVSEELSKQRHADLYRGRRLGE